MSLPYDANTSYTAGSAPSVKAADLNDLQSDDVRYWRMLTGEDFYFCDDFLGTNIDLTKWIDAGAFAKLSIVSRANASGCLRFLSSADGDSDSLTTRDLDIGLADFRFSSSIEIVSQSASYCNTTGIDGGTGGAAYFYMAGGIMGGNWIAKLGATDHDTGVAAAPSGTFTKLDIRRKNNVFGFYIDGILKYSETVAVDLDTSYIELLAARSGAGNTDVNWDCVKLWFAR